MIPFGSQLIGQTEKALNALLHGVLVDRRLSEREWVALRLASQFDGVGDVAAIIRDRAQFADAADLLSTLERRGFVIDGVLTASGAQTVDEVGQEIGALTEPVWASVDSDDAEAAARALNRVLDETRVLLRG